MPRPTPIKERLWRRIARASSGCWIWTGATSGNGYGHIRSAEGPVRPVHRVMYELLVGPIPDGLQIDHLCRNRLCCNPEHLEPVTRRENVRRGEGWGSSTHCLNGHLFDEANTRMEQGTRRCRLCIQNNTRRYQAKRKLLV